MVRIFHKCVGLLLFLRGRAREPGTRTGWREYRFVLNEKFLEVRNKSTYSARPKNPKGDIHDDCGLRTG